MKKMQRSIAGSEVGNLRLAFAGGEPDSVIGATQQLADS